MCVCVCILWIYLIKIASPCLRNDLFSCVCVYECWGVSFISTFHTSMYICVHTYIYVVHQKQIFLPTYHTTSLKKLRGTSTHKLRPRYKFCISETTQWDRWNLFGALSSHCGALELWAFRNNKNNIWTTIKNVQFGSWTLKHTGAQKSDKDNRLSYKLRRNPSEGRLSWILKRCPKEN